MGSIGKAIADGTG